MSTTLAPAATGPDNIHQIIEIPNVFSSSEWILKPRENIDLTDLADKLEELSECSSVSELSSINSAEINEINEAFLKSWYKDKVINITPTENVDE